MHLEVTFVCASDELSDGADWEWGIGHGLNVKLTCKSNVS